MNRLRMVTGSRRIRRAPFSIKRPKTRGRKMNIGPESEQIKIYLRACSFAEAENIGSELYEGLNLGAEFCDRRLPLPDEMKRASNLCKTLKKNLSIVTPVIREGAFERTCAWLEGVAKEAANAECVFNDWGLMLWMKDKKLPLRPIAGRLLGRQRRGPRSVSMTYSATPEEASCIRGSAWDDPEVIDLLTEMGVHRVELDMLLQGTRRPALPSGMSLSLCGPWLPVTLAPACPWSNNPLACPNTCLKYPKVEAINKNDPYPLWSRGNATFVNYGPMPGASLAVSAGADRIIWSEELPG